MAKYHRFDERNKHRGKKNNFNTNKKEKIHFEMKGNKTDKHVNLNSYNVEDYKQLEEEYENI